jgi:hypothetical protein
MGDLDRLIAAVEAGGDVPRPLYLAIPAHADIPTRHLAARIISNGKDMTAALGIHEALLPEWIWGRQINGAMFVAKRPYTIRVHVGPYMPPARALLLADLRAVKAMGEP